MKKVLKVLGYLLLIIVVLLAGLITYVKMALPNVGPAENLTVELTPERIARGKYLAHSVTVCMDCHSTRDWSKFSGPLVPNTLGKGGEKFDQTFGFPGVYYSKNITPAGIKDYTDGELYRAITTGVNRKGEALFPVMPYHYYGRMDPEDIKSIIAYIRTLTPIENSVLASKSDFPMNIIINTIPAKANPEKIPSKDNKIEYGRYMTNASGCAECHTRVDKGQIIEEFKFSGGREFRLSVGEIVRSANITPDMETGIGKWNREYFVSRFKAYSDSAGYVPQPVTPGAFNTVMPWTMYSNMTEEDLSAIFEYLQSLKPIRNSVVKFTPAGS
ncbi:MAG: c-type cytochrome [Chitinophagaceae bacterium]|nr:c-type cytochrome [Chitinophagaceae bacterium]